VGAAPLVTVKLPLLVAVPLEVATEILPLVAFDGTVAVIWFGFTTLNVAFALLNLTELTFVKFVPVIVTEVPGGPVVGLKPVIVGAEPVTMKSEELCPVPLAFVTEILPVVAPNGTVVMSWPVFTTLNVVPVLLKATPVMPVKSDPLTVTLVPGGPLGGLNPETVGPAAYAGVAMLRTPSESAATTATAQMRVEPNLFMTPPQKT
jgi:hypothetical protein